ncbi:MAG: AI-2E family transporter [Flavobacteriaceae bacterium]|nr:AI-2E family transporter [Flavobacteriaceae bacterium]
MTNSADIAKGILKAIATLVGISVVLYFLYRIQSILVYIAISAVVSLLARPLVRFMKNKMKIPNTIAVILAMLFFAMLFFGVISLFIPLIIEQSENLALLDIEKLKENLEYVFVEVSNYLASYNINLKELKTDNLFKDFTMIPNFLNTIFSALGTFGVGLFSVLFITFFLMKDSAILEKAIFLLVSDANEGKLQGSITKINSLLSRYFIGLLLQILILLVIYTTVLLIFGVKNALVIAFLCALLNIIPYIGPMVSFVLMAFLTITGFIGHDFQTEILPTTIYVMIGFFFAQLIDNFVSQPLIFSNSVKSHPLEIFLVIMIAGILFGVVGMIVAVPVYTAIKVILKTFLSENRIVKTLTKNM